MNPFEGCWHRIDRAAAHRSSAASEWATFLDTDPYDTRLEMNDQGYGSLWHEQIYPVPAILGVLFGEFLYNLRTALDYCIYDVAIHDSGQDPPPSGDRLQFPIAANETSFRRNQHQIEPLTEKHRGWVEGVQPYRGKYGPEGTALYWLNDLARKDRHRQLHVVGAYVSESSPVVFAPNATSIVFADVDRFVFVEGEAVIARFQVAPYSRGDQIQANPQSALDVEIAEFVQGRPHGARWLFLPLGERLRVIEALVRATIYLTHRR